MICGRLIHSQGELAAGEYYATKTELCLATPFVQLAVWLGRGDLDVQPQKASLWARANLAGYGLEHLYPILRRGTRFGLLKT